MYFRADWYDITEAEKSEKATQVRETVRESTEVIWWVPTQQ